MDFPNYDITVGLDIMGITFTIGQEEFLLGFYFDGFCRGNLSGVGNPTSVDKQFKKSYRTWHFVTCVLVNGNKMFKSETKDLAQNDLFFSFAKLFELET